MIYIFFILGTKGNIHIYFGAIDSGNDIIEHIQEKWSKHLNEDISFDIITKGFKNAEATTPS